MSNATAQKARLVWPDVAKGISIMGVCFLHVVMHVPGTDGSFANEINRWLGPVRMPLFFLVSGLFAYKVRTFSLQELWTKRLRYLVIPYLIWSPLEKIINAYSGGRQIHFDRIFEQVLEGDGAMWFLHALSVFVTFLWLTKFLPGNLSYLLAFTPYLVLLDPEPHPGWSRIILYLPVYCLGVFFRPMMLALASRINRWQTWLWAFVLFMVVQYLFENHMWVSAQLQTLGLDIPGPKVHTVLGGIRALGALPFAILACAAIAELPGLAKIFTYFGRNTLVIYIGHPIVLVLGFRWVMDTLEIRDDIADASAFITWLAIAYGLALCCFAGWLFEKFKALPIIGKTLDPSISWLGRSHTPARSSVVAAQETPQDPSPAAALDRQRCDQ